MNTRKRVSEILDIKLRKKDKLSFIINISLSVLIALNTIAIILHTVPSLKLKYDKVFLYFEGFSVFIFSTEYILRVWASAENPDYKNGFIGKIKYCLSAWSLIDLLAIIPFFFSYFSIDFGFIKVLRLLRILRLFRYSKYFHAITIIIKVLKSKKEELLLSMSFCMVLVLVLSSMAYYVEHDAQPHKFSSILDALWWGVNAMTTVGYGDLHPITPFGKFLGSIMAILGVCIFALPTGILASGFNEQMREGKHDVYSVKCPHCGLNHTVIEKKIH